MLPAVEQMASRLPVPGVKRFGIQHIVIQRQYKSYIHHHYEKISFPNLHYLHLTTNFFTIHYQ